MNRGPAAVPDKAARPHALAANRPACPALSLATLQAGHTSRVSELLERVNSLSSADEEKTMRQLYLR